MGLRALNGVNFRVRPLSPLSAVSFLTTEGLSRLAKHHLTWALLEKYVSMNKSTLEPKSQAKGKHKTLNPTPIPRKKLQIRSASAHSAGPGRDRIGGGRLSKKKTRRVKHTRGFRG